MLFSDLLKLPVEDMVKFIKAIGDQEITIKKLYIDWDKVNPNFNYVAKDENGEVWAFTHEPFILYDTWISNVDNYPELLDEEAEGGAILTLLNIVDWKQSLTKRPDNK